MVNTSPALTDSLFSPFAFMMALTVTPYFAAIEPRVSPVFTLYLKGVAVAADFALGVEVRGRGGVMVTIRVEVGNGTSI